MDLSKHIKSTPVELQRSAVKMAEYNPRMITDSALQTLKRGIKKYGLVGGIVVNKRTGNTVVSGHQRLICLDMLQKYNQDTKENDYIVRVDLIDVDEKSEKELNVLLNNPNAQGSWDYDRLREMIPEIDYKDAGLTESDLSMIGCDFLFETEAENNLASDLDDMMADVNEEHRQEVEARKEQRKLEKEADSLLDRQARIDHVKDVKAQVAEEAEQKARDMSAYVMLSFDTFEAKAAFCEQFGYDAYDRFLKGEDFQQRLEYGFEDESSEEE